MASSHRQGNQTHGVWGKTGQKPLNHHLNAQRGARPAPRVRTEPCGEAPRPSRAIPVTCGRERSAAAPPGRGRYPNDNPRGPPPGAAPGPPRIPHPAPASRIPPPRPCRTDRQTERTDSPAASPSSAARSSFSPSPRSPQSPSVPEFPCVQRLLPGFAASRVPHGLSCTPKGVQGLTIRLLTDVTAGTAG